MKALIINYNRLTLPVKIADYLFECGLTPIFIDNCSTYEPLLDYYKNSKYEVVKLNQNYGFSVIWDAGILDMLNIKNNEEHIITDSDLDISNIPKDFLSVLQEGLNRYSQYKKCGFSLQINDLPDNELTKAALSFELNYWKKPLDEMYFDAPIDTTFALYRCRFNTHVSIRTNIPYCAKHVPWYYTNFNDLPDDEKYYFSSVKSNATSYYSKIIIKMK